MAVLNSLQRQEYELMGYLLVSGLISDDIVTAAESRLRRMVESGAVASGHGAFEETSLVACYTPRFLEAAAELAGEPGAEYPPPRAAYIINSLPVPGPWKWPEPHIDHAIKEHGHRTFPPAFRIATMTFLSDVLPHGGGTVVWPESHRKIRALAESDLGKYDLMWALNQDLARADLGEPIELLPRRGDVLFYHYLCAHAGSLNVTDRPRLAMNCKW